MAAAPTALVVVFPGSNGDRDLLETLERVGFRTEYHPAQEPLPEDCRLAGIPGGFSYGDYWRAGMLASQAAAIQSLPDCIARGGLAIGICNGFQILVESGLLPGALSYNQPPGFRHGTAVLEYSQKSNSPWLSALEPGAQLRMPYAHGEGNYFHPEAEAGLTGRVPLTYQHNPNGSMGNTAALLDATGQILGIMPHPERASDPHLGSADGLLLFRGAFNHLRRAS